jgi:hypothetical protein
VPPQVRPPDAPPSKDPVQKGEIRYVPIPESYADSKKSSLRFTVQEGSQNFDLKLSRKK